MKVEVILVLAVNAMIIIESCWERASSVHLLGVSYPIPISSYKRLIFRGLLLLIGGFYIQFVEARVLSAQALDCLFNN